MSFWIEGSLTSEDLGEIIKGIREDYLGITQEELADSIDVKLQALISSENGKGAHIGNVLSRVCEKYKLETKVTIKPMPNVFTH